MPRGPRVDAPGAIHHVTVRGIERRAIFLDDADREAFLERLDRLARSMLFSVYAWALMPNHVHLVLRTRHGELPRLMARLGTSYALYFNRRHARVGYVFQNRYWSRPLDQDLETVVAYVHCNPLRAGLTTEAGLPDYPWCGHGTFVGARAPRLFERTGEAVPDAAAAPELAAVIQEECARAGVSSAAAAGGARSRAAAALRRRIVERALRETSCGPARVAAVLGISRSTVSQILRRLG